MNKIIEQDVILRSNVDMSGCLTKGRLYRGRTEKNIVDIQFIFVNDIGNLRSWPISHFERK